MYFPPITGMTNIVSCSTNVRLSLKGFNILAVSLSVPSSRDNTYNIWFQEHRPKHLIANGQYCNGLAKGVYFNQFQKQIPKCAACLPQYIDIISAVGQELLLIAENFVFLLLVPFQKSGSLIA